jgi:hypothetical protein
VGLVKHYLEQHEETSAAASDGDGDAGQPPLHCPFCDFACRHQLVLDHHVKGHGGTRLYKCTDCAYSTKNRQKITWHSRIHTGEKPYRCHLCPYACADPSRLKVRSRAVKQGMEGGQALGSLILTLPNISSVTLNKFLNFSQGLDSSSV